jgi:DNA-binding CsgD family transcriptional regulator
VGIPINYKGETTIQINARDVTKRKKTEAILQKTNERLKEKSVALEDMNATLRTLLNKKDQDVKEIEEKIFCNYDSIIMPFFDKLKNSYSNKVQRSLIETIETNLKEIISPFSKKLSDPMINFTPKEIQVASFIKQGITSKEIAQILDCSVRTIDTHRDNIRVKLKIKNKKINLRSYLMILL